MRCSAKLVKSIFRFCFFYAISLNGAIAAAAAEPSVNHPAVADRSAAVNLARQGQTLPALAILDRLRRAHPKDIGVARDFIVVSVWAGRESEAVKAFEALPSGPQPDYVVDAVALAYRRLGNAGEALVLYREGLRRSPNNPAFIGGEIHALVDLGKPEAALSSATTDLRLHGDRIDILLAAASAATAMKAPVEALRYIDRAIKLDPTSREARHDRIVAIDAIGAPQVALQRADEQPGTISVSERRTIQGDVAAALVRWGIFEPPSEELRFAATDRAITALDLLIAQWSREGDDAKPAILRARFDRMVALRDRVRMADVLAEYDGLKASHVTIPRYALVAVADAYLYFRHPKKARDLYLEGLEVDTHNPETRLALYYAYLDLEDFAAAYRQVDAESADQPIWHYLKGLSEPVENPDRATADLTAAYARLYGDELVEAHRRITAMADVAPNNTHYLSALADIYGARGWPRRAAEEYEISRALKSRDVATEVGQARNNLDLRSYRLAEAEATDLTRRFPENQEVQRLDRLLQVHNMAEFGLTVEPSWSSPTNVQGGSGIAIDAQLYSAPIDYNWRVFVSEHVAEEKLPLGEGKIALRRSAAGVEYRGNDLVVSLEATINAFGPNVDTTLRSGLGAGRAGAQVQADWSLNDNWSIGGKAEIFALDIPLRALANGITANAASTSVAYRQSESRAFTLTGEVMDFSDGNVRTSLDGQYTQRLLTRPHLTIDGIFGLAASQNSLGETRPYFNPSQDALGTVGLSIEQIIYRRYQFIYDHHLVITPGVYWQEGFGSGAAASVRYEHRLRINDVFDAGLGVTFSRQQYDGQYENTVAVLLHLKERF